MNKVVSLRVEHSAFSGIVFRCRNDTLEIFGLYFHEKSGLIPFVSIDTRLLILPHESVFSAYYPDIKGFSLFQKILVSSGSSWTFVYDLRKHTVAIFPKLRAAGKEGVLPGRLGDFAKPELGRLSQFAEQLFRTEENERGERRVVENHASTFSGPITVETLDEPRVLYKYGEPFNGTGGHFWSFDPPLPPTQHKLEFAMHDDIHPGITRGSQIYDTRFETVMSVTLPAGTLVFHGEAAPQVVGTTGFQGGATQVFVPEKPSSEQIALVTREEFFQTHHDYYESQRQQGYQAEQRYEQQKQEQQHYEQQQMQKHQEAHHTQARLMAQKQEQQHHETQKMQQQQQAHHEQELRFTEEVDRDLSSLHNDAKKGKWSTEQRQSAIDDFLMATKAELLDGGRALNRAIDHSSAGGYREVAHVIDTVSRDFAQFEMQEALDMRNANNVSAHPEAKTGGVEFPVGYLKEMQIFDTMRIMLPQNPNSLRISLQEVHQLLHELWVGIFVFNQIPQYSLDPNYDNSIKASLPPIYWGSLVEVIMREVDYNGKTLTAGMAFPQKARQAFAKVFREELQLNKETGESGIQDEHGKVDYWPIYKKYGAIDLHSDKKLGPFIEAHKGDFRILDKVRYSSVCFISVQKSYHQSAEVLLVNSELTVGGQLHFKEEYRNDSISVEAQERLFKGIRETEAAYATLDPAISKYVDLLQLMGFLIQFLLSLAKEGYMPDLSSLIQDRTSFVPEKELPPIAVNCSRCSNWHHLHGGSVHIVSETSKAAFPKKLEQEIDEIRQVSPVGGRQLNHTAISGQGYYVFPLRVQKIDATNPGAKPFVVARELYRSGVTKYTLSAADIELLFLKKFGPKGAGHVCLENPVFVAATHGLVDVVKIFHKNNPSILNLETGGVTPLVAASMGGHADVIRYLVQYVDVNQKYVKDIYVLTPLACAMFSGNEESVRILKEAGAKVEIRTEADALLYQYAACTCGDAAVLSQSIAAGYSNTGLLTRALEGGHKDCIRLAISADRAGLGVRGRAGIWSAFTGALGFSTSSGPDVKSYAKPDKLDIFKTLVTGGVDVMTLHGKYRKNILHTLFELKNLPAIQYLHEHRQAEFLDLLSRRQTPDRYPTFFYAAMCGFQSFFEWILPIMPELVAMRSKDGLNPFLVALKFKQEDLAKWLWLFEKTPGESVDALGRGPFYYCKERCLSEIDMFNLARKLPDTELGAIIRALIETNVESILQQLYDNRIVSIVDHRLCSDVEEKLTQTPIQFGNNFDALSVSFFPKMLKGFFDQEYPDLVRFLLRAGENPLTSRPSGQCDFTEKELIQWAARYDELDYINPLNRSPAEFSALFVGESHPFLTAVISGATNVLKLQMGLGVGRELRDKDGYGAIELAVLYDQGVALTMLLRAGFSNVYRTGMVAPPVHLAIVGDSPRAIYALYKHGVALDCTDSRMDLLISIVIASKKLSGFAMLIHLGVKVPEYVGRRLVLGPQFRELEVSNERCVLAPDTIPGTVALIDYLSGGVSLLNPILADADTKQPKTLRADYMSLFTANTSERYPAVIYAVLSGFKECVEILAKNNLNLRIRCEKSGISIRDTALQIKANTTDALVQECVDILLESGTKYRLSPQEIVAREQDLMGAINRYDHEGFLHAIHLLSGASFRKTACLAMLAERYFVLDEGSPTLFFHQNAIADMRETLLDSQNNAREVSLSAETEAADFKLLAVLERYDQDLTFFSSVAHYLAQINAFVFITHMQRIRSEQVVPILHLQDSEGVPLVHKLINSDITGFKQILQGVDDDHVREICAVKDLDGLSVFGHLLKSVIPKVELPKIGRTELPVLLSLLQSYSPKADIEHDKTCLSAAKNTAGMSFLHAYLLLGDFDRFRAALSKADLCLMDPPIDISPDFTLTLSRLVILSGNVEWVRDCVLSGVDFDTAYDGMDSISFALHWGFPNIAIALESLLKSAVFLCFKTFIDEMAQQYPKGSCRDIVRRISDNELLFEQFLAVAAQWRGVAQLAFLVDSGLWPTVDVKKIVKRPKLVALFRDEWHQNPSVAEMVLAAEMWDVLQMDVSAVSPAHVDALIRGICSSPRRAFMDSSPKRAFGYVVFIMNVDLEPQLMTYNRSIFSMMNYDDRSDYLGTARPRNRGIKMEQRRVLYVPCGYDHLRPDQLMYHPEDFDLSKMPLLFSKRYLTYATTLGIDHAMLHVFRQIPELLAELKRTNPTLLDDYDRWIGQEQAFSMRNYSNKLDEFLGIPLWKWLYDLLPENTYRALINPADVYRKNLRSEDPSARAALVSNARWVIASPPRVSQVLELRDSLVFRDTHFWMTHRLAFAKDRTTTLIEKAVQENILDIASIVCEVFSLHMSDINVRLAGPEVNVDHVRVSLLEDRGYILSQIPELVAWLTRENRVDLAPVLKELLRHINHRNPSHAQVPGGCCVVS